LDNGTAFIIWKRSLSNAFETYRSELWVNYFDGAQWGTSKMIHDTPSTYIANLTLEVNQEGKAVVVWKQAPSFYNPDNSNIWVTQFDGENWHIPSMISAENVPANTPILKIDNEKMVVAWLQQNEFIFSQYNGQSWELIQQVPELDDESTHTNLTLSLLGQQMTAIWISSLNGINQIILSRYNENSWDSPIILNDPANQILKTYAYAADQHGNAHIVWPQDNGE